MKNLLNSFLITVVIFMFFGNTLSQLITKSVSLPDKKPVSLKPYGSLGPPANLEPSGFVKSKLWKDVYWSHNDSGDIPRIFPVSHDGKIITSQRNQNYTGVLIPDAVNVDWEDIATDNSGNIYIGDIGNNHQNRRDLVIYIINEPYPEQGKTSVKSKIFYSYPDQTEIPAKKENFNAEALFWANEKLYILTKHYDDTHTKLYRLDSAEIGTVNTLTLLDRFDTRSNVTAADVTPDGKKLVLLTNEMIWLFEVKDNSDVYFDGKISWLPIEIEDYEPAEGITFDGDYLIISAGEQGGYLFKVPLSYLIIVRD